MKAILVLLHCNSNTGYAIGPLERTFYEMGLQLCDGDPRRVHFAYLSMAPGPSPTLPADFNNYLVLDTRSTDGAHIEAACDYVRRHGIEWCRWVSIRTTSRRQAYAAITCIRRWASPHTARCSSTRGTWNRARAWR